MGSAFVNHPAGATDLEVTHDIPIGFRSDTGVVLFGHASELTDGRWVRLGF